MLFCLVCPELLEACKWVSALVTLPLVGPADTIQKLKQMAADVITANAHVFLLSYN